MDGEQTEEDECGHFVMWKNKQMESRTACVGEFGWGGKLLYGNGSFQRSAQRRQKRLVEHKGKSWTSIGYAVIVRNAKARLSDP